MRSLQRKSANRNAPPPTALTRLRRGIPVARLLWVGLPEEAIVAGLDSDEAREAYVARMHGYARPEPTPEEMAAVQAERQKEQEKAAAVEAQRAARWGELDDLRKHPAFCDDRHPEHDAIIQKVKEATRVAYQIED